MTSAELQELLKSNPDLAVQEYAYTTSQTATINATPTSPGKTRTVPEYLDIISEHDAQVAVFAWIDANAERWPALRLAFSVPNGYYRNPATAGKVKASGARAGVPDLFLMVPSYVHGNVIHALAIEMKVGRNRPSEAQMMWIENLRQHNYMAVVCFGADEAIDTIKHYLGIEK